MQPTPPLQLAKDILKDASVLGCADRIELTRVARKHLKNTAYAFPTSQQLWAAYRELVEEGFVRDEKLEKAMRVKDVRTDSGVAPITVLTKPFPCPGRCVYCPTEVRMPKSYLSTEPAAARALSLKFDPYEQVKQRVEVLERNGHRANKIELIIKGGTWSAYTQEYREWFVMRCFEAANELNPNSPPVPSEPSPHPPSPSPTKAGEGGLKEAQDANETADYRIIGLTIETRPDWIKTQEVIHLRKLGVTRVELGLQIINDRVLSLTKRGTTVADAEHAIALCKTAGLKVDVHIMPGQPGASIEDDLKSFRLLFDDPRFRPDMVKIYPCVVLPDAELAEWSARGEFKPLEGRDLIELLIKMQTMVPRYCRIPRVIRDFPTTGILQGNKQSNLREMMDSEMTRRGLKCACLRCREVGHVAGDHTHDKTQLFEERYENAGGTEVFLSIENENRSAVFGFCRMRLPSRTPLSSSRMRGSNMIKYVQIDSTGSPGLRQTTPEADKIETRERELLHDAFPVLRDAAIIRELHTYGTALNIDQSDPDASQHKGYGRLLMQRAEEIAAKEGFDHLAVISGIGVREYYKILGYREQDGYMTKKLTTKN
ncbi:MAG: tRNA uridine(34) 5-carboxymethylaminomethyl modification radical SAM/GNAT enzyme Elp3 [Patescibacteria group bacterium]|nr:tRNA uridine(34) 5-carboxymethylaminomethyl modification radical SAM/GNAT enzyme Elp3 [Patescibacteria group bacterium]